MRVDPAHILSSTLIWLQLCHFVNKSINKVTRGKSTDLEKLFDEIYCTSHCGWIQWIHRILGFGFGLFCALPPPSNEITVLDYTQKKIVLSHVVLVFCATKKTRKIANTWNSFFFFWFSFDLSWKCRFPFGHIILVKRLFFAWWTGYWPWIPLTHSIVLSYDRQRHLLSIQIAATLNLNTQHCS